MLCDAAPRGYSRPVASLEWRRQGVQLFQRGLTQSISNDPNDNLVVGPGETLTRVIWEAGIAWRYFADVGPGYDGPSSLVIGLLLHPSDQGVPLFGPVAGFAADWLGVRFLDERPMPVPPTPGTSSFVDAVFSTGDQPVNTEGQRRIPPGSVARRLFLVADIIAPGPAFPLGAFGASAYISALVRVP